MAETISQYQIASFTVPQNGQPGDADQVRGNDNTVRAGFNGHDADAGIHFQSSTLAARPAAGTAGRKWFTADTRRIYYDNGSSWLEVTYLANGVNAVDVSVNAGNVSMTATTGNVAFQANNSGGIVNLIAGGGTNATGTINLSTGVAASTRWQVSSAGHLLAFTDGAVSIGQAGANRPDQAFVKTSVVVGASGNATLSQSSLTLGGNQVLQGRDTGWTAMTGSTNKATAYDTSTITLAQLAGRVMALQASLTTHGLIG